MQNGELQRWKVKIYLAWKIGWQGQILPQRKVTELVKGNAC
jgi:hypothetical protein